MTPPVLSEEEEADLAELVRSGEAIRLRELFGIPPKAAAHICGSGSASLEAWETTGLTKRHRREHRRKYYDFLCDLRELELLLQKYGKYFGASVDRFVHWREYRYRKDADNRQRREYVNPPER